MSGSARHADWIKWSDMQEGKGKEQVASDPFGAQVAAIRAIGVDALHLQTVLFPDTRTVVIPPSETWINSLPNYAGNEAIR